MKATLDFDLGENRKLADYPQNISADYFSRVEDAYNDHTPFRSLLITANDKMRYVIEGVYDNGLRDSLVAAFHRTETTIAAETSPATTIDINNIFGTTTEKASLPETSSAMVITISAPDVSSSDAGDENEIVTETAGESSEPTFESTESEATTVETVSETAASRETLEVPTEAVDSSYFAPVVYNDRVIAGKANWLFLAGENLTYYLGGNIASEDELKVYADTFNRLKQKCDEKGKKIAILLVPGKPQVYPEYMPTYELQNSYKRIERIVDYVHENSDIQIRYPLKEMLALKNYYLLYKKYDSHWNGAGSFLGYQLILQMLGLPTTNMLDVPTEVYSVGSGGGDLVKPAGLDLANYQMDFDYTIYYKTDVSILSTEGEYFRSDVYYRVHSDATNESQVTVIGDSFRNHMVLYMFRDFTDSSLVHVDMIGDQSVDNLLLESDTIVFMFAERNDKRVLATAEYVINLLSK